MSDKKVEDIECGVFVNKEGLLMWECRSPQVFRERKQQFGDLFALTAAECERLEMQPDFEAIGKMAWRQSDSFKIFGGCRVGKSEK